MITGDAVLRTHTNGHATTKPRVSAGTDSEVHNSSHCSCLFLSLSLSLFCVYIPVRFSSLAPFYLQSLFFSFHFMFSLLWIYLYFFPFILNLYSFFRLFYELFLLSLFYNLASVFVFHSSPFIFSFFFIIIILHVVFLVLSFFFCLYFLLFPFTNYIFPLPSVLIVSLISIFPFFPRLSIPYFLHFTSNSACLSL